ncbi:hypothetical protein BU14_1902s0001 [Porphyra umbilicalis]|uniref:Uncharacterized protein n=1 Tax=Porphyra umbilicalis TaxID=2786 RepID=A0A1X6NKE6_PORUM|nr:hypothetical protein BU14_1902s0001 [Porphyra umbilicalis]|eukprot:OSX69074.1 hypothetical protein BU14_1902s0001 [Porphyra umbilicalis]
MLGVLLTLVPVFSTPRRRRDGHRLDARAQHRAVAEVGERGGRRIRVGGERHPPRGDPGVDRHPRRRVDGPRHERLEPTPHPPAGVPRGALLPVGFHVGAAAARTRARVPTRLGGQVAADQTAPKGVHRAPRKRRVDRRGHRARRRRAGGGRPIDRRRGRVD